MLVQHLGRAVAEMGGKLRAEWHSDNDESGALKIVMTGAASDPPVWQQHIGGKARRELLATANSPMAVNRAEIAGGCFV